VPAAPIYEAGLAADRVAAAASVSRAAGVVLTGRCEMYLHGQRDLDAVIARLQAYSAAGADVLFAPGVLDLDEVRRLVEAVDKPVSVLPIGDTVPIAELASVGVARVSVGGGFAFAAYGALVEAATELRDAGTYAYRHRSAVGSKAIRAAFGPG
jgi:2-methylisocitrate lyase-like PEP mutase family enzyme